MSHDCTVKSSNTVPLGELGGIITVIRNRLREQDFKSHNVFPVWMKPIFVLKRTLMVCQSIFSCYPSWGPNKAGLSTLITINANGTLLYNIRCFSTLRAKKMFLWNFSIDMS